MSRDLKKQTADAVKQASKQGFEVEDRGDKWIVKNPNYDPALPHIPAQVTVHKTPSDPRGLKNCVALLRRIGINL